MLDPLFFLISRLSKACSPLVINLQIKDSKVLHPWKITEKVYNPGKALKSMQKL